MPEDLSKYDFNWLSFKDYAKLTDKIFIGGWVSYNSKGELGMRLLFHPYEWSKIGRK